MTAATKLLVTHDGKFHCDEVFAYAVLRVALGLEGGDHTLVRTRDAATIDRADIVWDVGSRYDPGRRRFDHHQRGAPARDDGTPFSAAGLVWQVYGVDAVRALCTGPDAASFAERIAAVIDCSIVRNIDRIDNGVAVEASPLGLSALIDDLNPTWDAAHPPGHEQALFLQAAELAAAALRRRVDVLRSRFAAEAAVRAALAASEDPRILVLDRAMPWKATVHAITDQVLFCIAPSAGSKWTVYAMPSQPGALDQLCPLPAEWAGLEGDALIAASGIPDAVFVHLRRFMGAASSRDGALAMARHALDAASRTEAHSAA